MVFRKLRAQQGVGVCGKGNHCHRVAFYSDQVRVKTVVLYEHADGFIVAEVSGMVEEGSAVGAAAVRKEMVLSFYKTKRSQQFGEVVPTFV